VHEDETCGSSIEVSSAPITPAETRDGGGDDDCHSEKEPKVVLVLPANEGVVGQVGAIGDTWFTTRMNDHPADVRPEKTVVGAIRIQVGVGITMVGTMTS
jgi:hypothetical protein